MSENLKPILESRCFAVLFALFFIAAFVGLAAVRLGPLAATVFSIASIGGFLLWLATTFRTPIDPNKVIIPYLLAVILFIVHVYEEYLTDFESAIFDISGFHVMERDFLSIAAFLAPALWIGCAILLLKKTHMGFYFLSFFYVAMIIAELSHFIFPFMEDGTFHYVSGMYTAALPLIPALYGLRITLKEIKRKPNNDR